MNDIRFQVTGRTAREVAQKMGALIEGDFGRRAESTTDKDGSVVLTLPGSLLVTDNVAAHRGLHDKLSRLIGIAQWEVRNGVIITMRAGDDKGAGMRVDEAQPATVLELAARK